MKYVSVWLNVWKPQPDLMEGVHERQSITLGRNLQLLWVEVGFGKYVYSERLTCFWYYVAYYDNLYVLLADARSCVTCDKVLAELEKIDDDTDSFGVDFVKINDKRLAKQYGIKTFPALTYFRYIYWVYLYTKHYFLSCVLYGSTEYLTIFVLLFVCTQRKGAHHLWGRPHGWGGRAGLPYLTRSDGPARPHRGGECQDSRQDYWGDRLRGRSVL